VFGVRKMGLVKADRTGITTMDAALVNPKSTPKKLVATRIAKI
jgi:hypothetical protein